MFAALPSPPATKALDPNLFPRLSLRHAVYADLLHFGLETAKDIAAVRALKRAQDILASQHRTISGIGAKTIGS